MADDLQSDSRARTKRSLLLRGLVATFGFSTALLAIAFFCVARWFLWPATDAAGTAHAVVVFAGGEDGDRLRRAVELMEDGVAPKLVISEGNQRWFRGPELGRLCRNGSDEFEVMCVTPEPDSTKGEAEIFGQIAQDEGWAEVILVSSEVHLHRAQLWLDRCFDGTTRVVGVDTSRGFGEIRHEALGTLHALALDRSCSNPSNGVITADNRLGETPTGSPSPSEAAEIATGPDGDDNHDCPTWVGRRFMMSLYSVPVDHPDTRTVSQVATDGYTHVGPWYGDDRWTSGTQAAELGLCTVFSVGLARPVEDAIDDMDGSLAALRADMDRALADETLNQSISAWSLLPEELNIYRPGHIDLLELLAEEARARDPLQRPTYIYLASNADERMFEVGSELTDILGQGNYLSTNGLADQRGYLVASIQRADAARKAMGQPDDVVVPVVEHRIHSGTLTSEQSPLIETWVRHDLLTTFVAGADGFFAFSGFPPKEGLDDFQRYNDAYTSVLAEIRDSELTEFVDSGTVDPSIEANVVSGPAELRLPTLFNASRGNPVEVVDSVSVRAWRSGAEMIVLAVNHSNEPVEVEIVGLDAGIETVTLPPLGTQLWRPIAD